VLLEGKTAVVTGGTRGLGRAIADRLAVEGATVVRAGRSGGDVPLDVRDEESVRALFAAVADRHGRLDVLVASAGVSRPGPVADLDPAAWREVLDTNLTGTFLCLRAAAPLLERSGDGRVVVLSSVLGRRVVPGASAYCASKAAVEALTRVAALELADRGITVNGLSPGFIDEGMGRELAANERVWSQYRPKLAAGRLGTAAEVAAAALFLVSAAGSYVNGHVLDVDGGLRW
jgi:3-oxoacyl-[acyl-carrier protein] reductase